MRASTFQNNSHLTVRTLHHYLGTMLHESIKSTEKLGADLLT